MTEPYLSPEDLDVLAAELAFGLLEGTDKASAMRRQLEDPAFAANVSLWRNRGGEWTDNLEPEQVPEHVWGRLQLSLGHSGEPPAADDKGTSTSRGWRHFALLSGAACITLAVALAATLASHDEIPGPDALPPIAGEQTATNVAQIADKAGAPLLTAVYHPRTGKLTMRVSDLETPDKAPELWVLDKAGKPHSLGLIDTGGSLTIELSDDLRALLVEGATIAITVEDREGAPHAAPEGEILGTAKLSTI
jgi:anti-sigma-K factor RskA